MEILSVLLAVSLIGNAFLARRAFARIPRYDASAKDLLHDLTRRGTAIVKVDMIDPSNLMLRSPRT